MTSPFDDPIRLTRSQMANALVFWRLGDDTFDIARKLNVQESAVYCSLAEHRDQIWVQKQKMARLRMMA